MKKIGLLNCGGAKRKGPAKAKDLYSGYYFWLTYLYMKHIIQPDDIFIVSTRINNFTFLPELQKEKFNRVEDWKMDDIHVFTHVDDIIYPYGTEKPATWSVPVIRRLMNVGTEKFIQDYNIEPNEVEVHSLLGRVYGEPVLEYFPNHHLYFQGLRMGYRIQVMKEELENANISTRPNYE